MFREVITERVAVSIVAFATLDDVDPVLKVVFSFDFGMEAEAVQQLRPELTFFGIPRTDQNKARRMLDRNSFTFDFVSTRDCHVEQKIDQVIFEQVYFVDIKKAAIRTRE